MTPTPDGLRLSLSSLTPALREQLLRGWEQGEAGHHRSGDTLELPHAALWALDDEALGALGVRRYTGRLTIVEDGVLLRTSYRWRLGWGGQQAQASGGWLRDWRGKTWLLHPGLRVAARLAGVVAEAAAAGQRGRVLAAIAQLQRVAAGCDPLELPARLARTAIREATAVRVEVGEGEDGPTVRPVVLARATHDLINVTEANATTGAGGPQPVPATAARQTDAPPPQIEGEADEADAGAATDHSGAPAEPWGPVTAADELGQPLDLTAASLIRSVEQHLDDAVWTQGDTHLLLPAAVSRNLMLVEVARTAPAADRLAFLDNPLAFLPDPGAFDEADFSARVVGLREAPRGGGRRPLEPRTWATPLDGLLLELPDGPLWVPADELAPLAEALRTAQGSGAATVPCAGRAVPVRPDLIDAIERVLRPPSTPDGREDDGPRPLILAIKENELQIEWAPDRAPRRPLGPLAAPLVGGLQLKPHQAQALQRLRALWVQGERGALLCDDMGLGKTLQGVCFAAWVCAQLTAGGGPALRSTGRLPLLLVAPPSLLRTWFEELEARLDDGPLRTIVWAGDSPARSRRGRRVVDLKGLRRDEARVDGHTSVLQHARIDLEAWDKLAPDALFIGYDSLRSLQHAIGRLDVGLLVADEVQAVKDPTSLRAHALRAMQYDFALALTGTPIENSWVDLWSICDVAVPGHLGTREEFVRDYPPSGEVVVVGAALQARLAKHLIRRTRAATLGDALPPCEIRPDRRAMPPAQALAYRAELARAGKVQGAQVLGLLQGLARVSLHPRPRAALGTAEEARAWMQLSARTAAALEALDAWAAAGEAVLIFVRSLAVQETLSRALSLIYGLPPVPVLNGALSFAARQATVGHVRAGQGFRVLIVSPDVGGAGWNLQFAARSLLLERPFNPAVEAQMVARTWRLGQARAVEVLAPVALLEGTLTFDEVLDGLLEEKRELADSVLAPCQVSERELSARFGAVVGAEPEG